ncbi:MAG: hypothetical protein MUF04_00975 [Akkermansiaceae bacterium]|nr:hypothetical protein [Akkermansiaceae bacterium]
MLLLAVVLAAVWLERLSVPVIVVALGAGILFGSDVLNIWHFDNTVLDHAPDAHAVRAALLLPFETSAHPAVPAPAMGHPANPRPPMEEPGAAADSGGRDAHAP